jgi:hypothetical protein
MVDSRGKRESDTLWGKVKAAVLPALFLGVCFYVGSLFSQAYGDVSTLKGDVRYIKEKQTDSFERIEKELQNLSTKLDNHVTGKPTVATNAVYMEVKPCQ